MIKLPLFTILTATVIAVHSSVSAAEMFENLNFGDSKEIVIKKLERSKRFDVPEETIFGSSAIDGSYKLLKKHGGLAFVAQLKWDTDQNLMQVDLYSQPADRSSLESAYSDLNGLLTAIYGKPKFSNGLPPNSNLTQDGMTEAGAVWFSGSDAIAFSLGKLDGKYNLIISFMDDQPELVRTP